MPAEIARHLPEELEEFRRLPFTEVCFRVVRPFATPDVPEEVLWQIVSEAINFPVKLVSLSPALHILELFHGPTLAFKDFGARFMARLMGYFVRGESRQLTVLVATSGDTGSAVAHGFLRVPGIRVVILYPSKRISEAQEKQFTTLGENITALEVEGTFDDCQRLVKQAFADEALNQRAFLTSANSINVGRLLAADVLSRGGVPATAGGLGAADRIGAQRKFRKFDGGNFCEAHRIAGDEIHRGHKCERRRATLLAFRRVPAASGSRYVFQRNGRGQPEQFSAAAGFVPQPH